MIDTKYDKIRDGAFDFPELSSLPDDGGEEFNRLVFSSSPYLLQHARNPVDWYPWGDEAFEKAKHENKPIFLSIGYSTCHWCHVMEHESFEDHAVANFLKEHFVSIKLDREERPDIDSVYMTVCQMMTGAGGWPLTVFMTPDKEPFYAGTYFPREDSFGRPGFLRLLEFIRNAWESDQQKITAAVDDIVGVLKRNTESAAGSLAPGIMDDAVKAFVNRFDSQHGGFGPPPKFPMAHTLVFLLRQYERTGDLEVWKAVEKTLRSMYNGGLYDHVGYGFTRYSTDAQWLVPHFEKMLYDNALLIMAYTEAYQKTGDEFYARVVRETFAYLHREMTDAGGGFYSAENADSEGEEGKFYVFTEDEFYEAVGKEKGPLLAEYFDVSPGGNFEGKNIPHVNVDEEKWFESKGMSHDDGRAMIEEARRKLFDYRATRVHPSLDDKILTSWNGLMISALAQAGFALNDDAMTSAAKNAADFILAHLCDDDGRLLHRHRAGESGIPGFLDDYAFFVWGLIDLYQSTFDPAYLEHAVRYHAEMMDLFGDGDRPGLFYTAHDAEDLITRSKEYYDGAVPSGNSAAAYNAVRLSRLTGDSAYAQQAEQIFNAAAENVNRGPANAALLLTAYDMAMNPGQEIVLAGATLEDIAPFLDALRGTYLPRSVRLFNGGGVAERLAELAPFASAQGTVEGKPAAYICENFACKLPVTDAEELRKQVRS